MFEGFKKYSSYMSPGIYQWDPTLRFILKSDSNTERNAYRFFYNHYSKMGQLILGILRKLFFRKKVIIKEDPLGTEGFKGEVSRPFRSINHYQDQKIFNFVEKKVLSVFCREEDFQRTLEIYHHFHLYFPMPELLWKDEKGWKICEELICPIPLKEWDKEDKDFVMDDLLTRTFRYVTVANDSGYSSDGQSLSSYLDVLGRKEVQFIFEHLDRKFLERSIPFVKLHGDMWAGNTLLIKEENIRRIIYIDWEYCRKLPFFYDIFTFIWLEFYIHHENYFFNRYIEGAYDDQLKKIFSQYNIPYLPDYRMDYFHLYFLYFYIFRVSHLAKHDRIPYLKKYQRLIKEREKDSGS